MQFSPFKHIVQLLLKWLSQNYFTLVMRTRNSFGYHCYFLLQSNWVCYPNILLLIIFSFKSCLNMITLICSLWLFHSLRNGNFQEIHRNLVFIWPKLKHLQLIFCVGIFLWHIKWKSIEMKSIFYTVYILRLYERWIEKPLKMIQFKNGSDGKY